MNVKKILIVDDQQGIRLLLNEIFRMEGYDTYLAASGSEALHLFEEHEIDGVLLDMKIPGMNGLEILKEIKQKKENVYVFMMTAYGEQDIIKEALALGAMGYFTKPFNIFEVLQEINQVLLPSKTKR